MFDLFSFLSLEFQQEVCGECEKGPCLFVGVGRDKLEDMDVSLEMSASLKGPTLQTWITQKWPNIFKSFFLYMKILDIWDYLQLVSCIYVYSSWNESILKKKFSKICFRNWVEKCDFLKNVKNYSTLTMRCDQTTWPTANQKVSVERQSPYLSFGTLGF